MRLELPTLSVHKQLVPALVHTQELHKIVGEAAELIRVSIFWLIVILDLSVSQCPQHRRMELRRLQVTM